LEKKRGIKTLTCKWQKEFLLIASEGKGERIFQKDRKFAMEAGTSSRQGGGGEKGGLLSLKTRGKTKRKKKKKTPNPT